MKRLLLLLSLVCVLSAQEFRSTLTGRIVDPSGAAVPNASVTVTNTDTGAHVVTKSGPDGYYTAPFLVPGPYEMSAEAPGFKKYVHGGINVQAEETVTENVHLEVGSTSETVVVTADAPLVESESATSGQVLTAREVENLPSNGRSPIGFVRDEYGVVPKEKHALAVVRPFDNAGGGDFSLGGANASSNEILLNGVPNMEDSSRTAGFSPLMDAVDEVRVDQFESDASYGDTAGGTVNITTKSGTNQFHGTLSEFNQTSKLAAGLYFTNAAGQKGPVTRQNQYGGTIGGPVLIPKVFNGHNKLFFFYAYEGFKDSTPTSVITTVPTAAERTGDFSALLALGSSYQMYNPFNASSSNGRVTRQRFSGNIIDPSLLNPVALKYLQFYPQPNLRGKADGENNFISTTPNIDNYFSNMGRVDYNVSDTNKLFFDLHESSYLQNNNNTFNNIASGGLTDVDMWGGVLDDVYTLSPTLVLDARLGFTRTDNLTTLPSAGFDATSLGFPTYINRTSTYPLLPRIAFSEGTGAAAFAGLSAKPGSPSYFTETQFFAAVTKIWGQHTIKAGPDIRLNKLSQINGGYSSGFFTFSPGTWVSAGTGAVAPTFGSSLAQFLLGLPSSGQYDVNEPTTSNNSYYGFFIQDAWKIKPNLTLNLGLRMEHETPIVESNNRQVIGFDPTAANAATQAAQAAYATIYANNVRSNPLLPSPASFRPTGGLVFASPSHRSGYETASLLLGPRAGLAWSPARFHGKTVFRGGFGIYTNPFNDYNTGPSTGFSQTTLFVPTSNNFLSPAATLSDPFPPGSNAIQQPTGSTLGVNTYLGNDIAYYTPNPKNPYSERWSVDIQQQLA
ncbi:MAG: carboxypeptidase regulatory-like domain-containing protein, partial [Acidobacteriaceae bacterium]|nr:carboxypeptidase regulatory-like domain-containing protein [Acidobacteriaceae bacterium]